MSCIVCRHPRRQEIDQALIARSATLTDLSRQYGLSSSALQHHQAHLQVKMEQAREGLQNHLRQSCYVWLTQALEMTMATARAAQAEDNFKLLLQAISQGTRLVNTLLKQDLPLDGPAVYDLLTSPGWADQSGLLPLGPEMLARGRESLPAILSAPCPEEAPPSPPAASPEPLNLTALQAVQQILGKPPRKNPELETENLLLQLYKSGLVPVPECCELDEEEEYISYEMEKLESQVDWEALLDGLPTAEARAKEEAILDQLRNSITIPTDKPLSEYLREHRQINNHGQYPKTEN